MDFVKIDVEGCEYNIIENSSYLKTVKFIEIEFHNYDINISDFIRKNLPSHKIEIFGLNHILLGKI